MDFEVQSDGNLVYNDEDGKFTFVDMREYVGYLSRAWYDEVPSCWRLMFYDENKEESPIHIEALVDVSGAYSRLIIKQDNIKRVLQIRWPYILEDSIYVSESEDSFFPKEVYVAFDDPYREKSLPLLDRYLQSEQQFISNDGEIYNGNLTSNSYVTYFFRQNDELVSKIGSQDKRR